MNNTNIMASRGTKGGLARATILSKNRRTEIAKKAAETKWMKKREESQKKDIMQVLEGFKSVLRIKEGFYRAGAPFAYFCSSKSIKTFYKLGSRCNGMRASGVNPGTCA